MASILLIDSDAAARQRLAPELEARDWRVEEAGDSVAASTCLQARPIDAIVTDYPLPDLDLQRLAPQWPVIVHAASATPEQVVAALRAPVFSFFHKPAPVQALLEAIRLALADPNWRGDITVASAQPQWTSLEVRCKMSAADRVVQFLREIKRDLPEDQRDDVCIAFRELLLNAIEHGGGSDPENRIHLSCIRTARAILCLIQDPGPGFSLTEIAHAAVCNPDDSPTRHLELRAAQGTRPGGFGILLARHIVDELIYNQKGNEVLFVKYLG